MREQLTSDQHASSDFSDDDFQALSPFQRIMLVTDGTLTAILEAYYLEPIRLIKLNEERMSSSSAHPQLAVRSDEPVLRRTVLLQGARTETNFVYAETQLNLAHLSPAFHTELTSSMIPLGQLWLRHKIETFKEPIHAGRISAGDHAHFFGCAPSTALLTRSYRVISLGHPIMVINEIFRAD